jgi:hypothetical protein
VNAAEDISRLREAVLIQTKEERFVMAMNGIIQSHDNDKCSCREYNKDTDFFRMLQQDYRQSKVGYDYENLSEISRQIKWLMHLFSKTKDLQFRAMKAALEHEADAATK